MKPRLLDLFCGAGGCARGYQMAGFHVTGVDINPQPRYIGDEFIQDDALDYLRKYGDRFDVIHASPPCQKYSITRNIGSKKEHPDLVGPTRGLLEEIGKPYIIENVPGSPLQNPVLVCGLALGLMVKRHRLFESSFCLFGTTCPRGHKDRSVTVAGHAAGERGKRWYTAIGSGEDRGRPRRASMELAKEAMGIDWMVRDEITQAIPPAYTFFLGRQILRILENLQPGPADELPVGQQHTEKSGSPL